jgi:hypothetical protein
MGQGQRAQHLVHHVEPFAARGVLVCLLHEGVDVELSGEGLAPAASGHLHVHPLGGHDVLRAQQPGPISRQLGLAGPLEEGQPDRQHGQAREGRQRSQADQRQHRRNGAVEGMAAHDVPELVGEQDPQLIIVQQLDGGGVNHDERLIDPVCAGVEKRSLRHVQLGHRGPIECGDGLVVQVPELGKLGGPDSHRVALKEQPHAPLAAQQRQGLANHLVDTGNGAQGLKGGAIGRVLPGDGGNLREGAARALGWKGRAHGRLGLGTGALRQRRSKVSL